MDSFLNHLKVERRVFRLIDRMVMVTYPIYFMIGLYLFDRYIAHIRISRGSILFLALLLGLTMIILAARHLGRDVMLIEHLIVKELEMRFAGRMEKESFRVWKSYKARYFRIEIVPVIILLLLPIGYLWYPNSQAQKFFRPLTIFIGLSYLLTFGTLRLISFKQYLNDIMRLYLALATPSCKEKIDGPLMQYGFRNIVAQGVFIGMAFLFICYFVILPDRSGVDLFLFTLGFSSLLVLGVGLRRAHRGFYHMISQVDELRRKIDVVSEPAESEG